MSAAAGLLPAAIAARTASDIASKSSSLAPKIIATLVRAMPACPRDSLRASPCGSAASGESSSPAGFSPHARGQAATCRQECPGVDIHVHRCGDTHQHKRQQVYAPSTTLTRADVPEHSPSYIHIPATYQMRARARTSCVTSPSRPCRKFTTPSREPLASTLPSPSSILNSTCARTCARVYACEFAGASMCGERR